MVTTKYFLLYETKSRKSYHNFNHILHVLNNYFSWSKTVCYNIYYSNYLPHILVRDQLLFVVVCFFCLFYNVLYCSFAAEDYNHKFVVIVPCLQDFASHYTEFTEAVAQFDQRLGHIVCQAFEDCSGTDSIFKVRCGLFPMHSSLHGTCNVRY